MSLADLGFPKLGHQGIISFDVISKSGAPNPKDIILVEGGLLAMIALSAVQSFVRVLVQNPILFINTPTMTGQQRPYLAIIANNE